MHFSKKKRVIIACEYSGRVREAFRKLGHDAWSCDLLPAEDSSPYHYHCDVRLVLDEGWDLLIAHPDCTYLTGSAAWAYKDGPYHQKVKPGTLVGEARRIARDEALKFVELLAKSNIPSIGIENPARGFLNTMLDLKQFGFRSNFPTQVITPNQFGHDASKDTGLALKNLPDLVPTNSIPPRWVCCGKTLPPEVGMYGCPNCEGTKRPLPRWANQTDSGQNNLTPSDNRWKDRARTYQGWADAMAAQWGGIVIEDDRLREKAIDMDKQLMELEL